MTTQVQPQPVEQATDDDPDHYARCNNENVAWCGADISDDPWCPDDCPHPICPMCEVLVHVGYECLGGCQ